jgi:hydrogenase/urease accessory protein HupE
MRCRIRNAFSVALAALFLWSGAGAAEAHDTLRLGPFAGGILHPLETPAQVLILAGLGLLLGRAPPFRLGRVLGIFAPAAALGMLLTLADHAAPMPVLLMAGLATAVGALLASGWPTKRVLDDVLLAILGLVLGLDSGFINPSALVVAKVLFGNWVSLLVIVGYVAFYVSLIPPVPWVRNGIRVLGSWIVAISLLVLAAALART